MRINLFLGLLLAAACPVAAHDHAHLPAGSRGLEFHANKGQWPQQVLYRAMTPGGAVFVEQSAFTYGRRSGCAHHSMAKEATPQPDR